MGEVFVEELRRVVRAGEQVIGAWLFPGNIAVQVQSDAHRGDAVELFVVDRINPAFAETIEVSGDAVIVIDAGSEVAIVLVAVHDFHVVGRTVINTVEKGDLQAGSAEILGVASKNLLFAIALAGPEKRKESKAWELTVEFFDPFLAALTDFGGGLLVGVAEFRLKLKGAAGVLIGLNVNAEALAIRLLGQPCQHAVVVECALPAFIVKPIACEQ